MAGPTLADVLARFGPAYLAAHRLGCEQARVWRAIVTCRTHALGGQLERCACCGAMRHVYHSCRNRHCPQCQRRAKEAWLAARRRELLPVPYFHLVFTLPHALNALAARAPRLIYDTLFAAASATLNAFAASARHLGGQSAFSLVLHTWAQDLRRHIHVHALVAGGALSNEGRWAAPRRGFLFPVKALSRVYRGKFIAQLQAQPHGLDARAWRALCQRLHAHDWVVYAKQPLGGPEPVLDYLARYTHRVAVSNERIIGIDGDDVLLRVRSRQAGAERRVVRLSGVEFIARFLAHVLPSGFKRIRHYGLLASACKRTRLGAARQALGAAQPDPHVIETLVQFLQRIDRLETLRCPHCGGAFVVLGPLAPTGHPRQARGPP
ncbi:MAG: IS91 family transposase [Rhodocyclaceae bacterium]|nr:IS91 family transposase [Rhodocyclaceae bacterium]MCB1963309.1 IS91 family transposase [Rhodocyclaceae bacterium]